MDRTSQKHLIMPPLWEAYDEDEQREEPPTATACSLCGAPTDPGDLGPDQHCLDCDAPDWTYGDDGSETI